MWIFTPKGFMSIAQHTSLPDSFQVKSRVPDPLSELWPDHEIQVIDWADYRYRINISKEDAIPVIIGLLESIDYSNFKNECVGMPEYHRSLGKVWGAMFEFQKRMEGR